ncbi:AAA family ATPase [Corallococcus exiguus]|uniref:ATP-binding protein n=1 Tax=Corallococcus TaxID=83461 RepID=UPI0011C4A81D|nr:MULTISPECIES: ATP-binding protein [Corallococcus]NPC46772.1 AAA family ATPase [Corallococcus exiguus]
MTKLKQGAEMTQDVHPLGASATEVATHPQLLSDYAPLNPDGALPPAVDKELVRRVYEKVGLSLLANLTGPDRQAPSPRSPAYIVLRNRLNLPGFRQHLRQTSVPTSHKGEKVCGFELNLYFHLCLKARGVYGQSIKPAESLRNGIPYLDPKEFARLVKRHCRPLRTTGALKAYSDKEYLALFVLAFGLLQPEDAPALVRPLLSLGAGFHEFFKVRPVPSVASPTRPRLGPEVVPPHLQVQLHSSVGTTQEPSSAASSSLIEISPEQVLVEEDFGRRLDEFEQARGALHALLEIELPCAPAAATNLIALREAVAGCEQALLQLQQAANKTVAQWRSLRMSLKQLGAEPPPEPAIAEDFARLHPWLVSENAVFRHQLQERQRHIHELGARLQQACLDLDGSALGSDGILAREALDGVQAALETYRLEAACEGLTLFQQRLQESVQALSTALQRLEAARTGADQIWQSATQAGLSLQRFEAREATSIVEREQQARYLEQWTAAIEHQLKEKHEADARAVAEAVATAMPSSHDAVWEQPLRRPQIEEDAVILACTRGQKPDIWMALDNPEAVPPIVYLERLTQFRLRAAEVDEVLSLLGIEGGDTSARSSRAALAGWLWTLIRKDVELRKDVESSPPQLAVAGRLCDALAGEGEAETAFVLAHCLSSTESLGTILDTLYLKVAQKGAAARSRILVFMPRWEPSGQPPPNAPRAWLVALSMVEAALAAPEDLERKDRAAALINALPRNPTELAQLLADALEHGGEAVAQSGGSSAKLISELGTWFSNVQKNQDRWRNWNLRSFEEGFIESIRQQIPLIEQAQSPQALEAIEFQEVREKKLRSLIWESAKGKEDPTQGTRFQKFVAELQGYDRALRDIVEARRAELTTHSHAEEARERLRNHLPLMSVHQSLVARCVLGGVKCAPGEHEHLAGDLSWDTEWFSVPGLLKGLDASCAQTRKQRLLLARQLLERVVVSSMGLEEQPILRAYFAARLGDQRTCGQQLGVAAAPFIRKLAKFNHDARLGELRTICDLAEDLLRHAAQEEYDASAASQLLTDLHRRLSDGEPGDIDTEEAMRLLSELGVGVSNQAEQNRVAANQLHMRVNALEEAGKLHSPLVRRCITLGKAAMADSRFVLALEAFRLAIDHAADNDDTGKSALKAFLDKMGSFESTEETDTESRRPAFHQAFERLEQDTARKRQDFFDVAALEKHLEHIKGSLVSEQWDAVAAGLEQAKQQLRDSKLCNEPPGLVVLLSPPNTPRAIQQSDRFTALRKEYTALGADPAQVARRLAILREFSVPRDAPVQRTAFLAELARVRALEYAYAGEGDAARQCCEVAFFLQRRWAVEWQVRKVGVPRPPEDPMHAVVLLVATHLLARVPVEHKAASAEWLAPFLKNSSVTPEHLKAALAADTAREHLARLLGVCWMLPTDDSERALVQSLRRISLWEESPGWIAEHLAGLLRTEADLNARRQLSYLLSSHVAEDHEWALDFLGHLARSGRSEEAMPHGEQQTWNLVRSNLAIFGRSIGAQRVTQRDQLLRRLLLAQHSKLSKSFAATLDGIKEALVELNVPSDPPQLHIFLEETHATVEGSTVDFVLALENRGIDIIDEMRVTSQSQSQIVVGEDEPLLLTKDLLHPRQTTISRVQGRLRSPDDQGSTTLGLRITYRSHDERSYEKLLNVVIPTRARTAIPVLERATLKQLFSESGNEVSKVGQNFFGRERELEELQLRLLDQELPEGLILMGMRRIGKTSLARVFLERAKERGAATAFVDFKQYSGRGDGQESPLAPWRTCSFLATRLLESTVGGTLLAARLGFTGFRWKQNVHQEFSKAPFPTDFLREILEEMARQLAPQTMVVVVDELDYLVNFWESSAHRRDVYDFFNMMRSLLSPGEGPLRTFRWLLSGSDRCSSMFADYQNPLHGSIKQQPVHSMSQQECDQILQEPFASLEGRPITINASALREVFEVTGGFPFFVQMLGSRLCNVLLERPSDLVSRWHVREAVRRSLPSDSVAEAPAPYDKVLEPIKDHGDHPLLEYLLSLIARKTSEEEPRVRYEEMLQASEELLGAELPRARVMAMCKLLAAYKMIAIEDENGRLYFRIRFPLVRRLVQTKYDYSLAVTKEQALRHLTNAA